ncbi:CDP-alcohol phosphatidyltransferase family protein [Rhizomonospora bruguierae]|uniref:CDP-alcohol phosphatidyltransferase family protein n=1 Tax=Rhizomonospora bruguierae TaxID=1581705 RepID=UPI001BD15971|nr:CDP-alcohol phosphatidyltransferase family protein [Micromonospora sp. NBRC 107566]
MERASLAEIRVKTYKSRDSWWTVLLVDPLASRLVRLVSPYRSVTPNRLSLAAALIGLVAAACFAFATPWWLVAGAVLFHFAFVADCMDGKVGRLNGTGTVFGAWLDYMLDRVRVVTCTAALMGGLWAVTHNPLYLVLGGVVVFLDMFHHLNSLEISRVKGKMRSKLSAAAQRTAIARGETGALPPRFVEEVVVEVPSGDASQAVANRTKWVEREVVDLNEDFRARFGLFVRLRNLLRRGRIRPNVMSTVELHMAVFIIGPLIGAATGHVAGAVAAVTVVAGALLLVFDLAIIYKLYLSTKGFEQQLAKAIATAEAAEAAAGIQPPVAAPAPAATGGHAV